MKTISEVENLLGVTRRTLQEYDDEKLQLLHPSKKDDTDKGKWLYDDEALQKLEIITVFREIGYKRLEIKEIINKPSVDLRKSSLPKLDGGFTWKNIRNYILDNITSSQKRRFNQMLSEHCSIVNRMLILVIPSLYGDQYACIWMHRNRYWRYSYW